MMSVQHSFMKGLFIMLRRSALNISERIARGYYEEDPAERVIRLQEKNIATLYQMLAKCGPEKRQTWLDCIREAEKALALLRNSVGK